MPNIKQLSHALRTLDSFRSKEASRLQLNHVAGIVSGKVLKLTASDGSKAFRYTTNVINPHGLKHRIPLDHTEISPIIDDLKLRKSEATAIDTTKDGILINGTEWTPPLDTLEAFNLDKSFKVPKSKRFNICSRDVPKVLKALKAYRYLCIAEGIKDRSIHFDLSKRGLELTHVEYMRSRFYFCLPSRESELKIKLRFKLDALISVFGGLHANGDINIIRCMDKPVMFYSDFDTNVRTEYLLTTLSRRTTTP